MNKQEEIKNPALLSIIKAIKKSYSSDRQNELNEELRKSKLLVPAKIHEENKINIIKITDEKGNDFIPVFTDWDNLQLNHEFSRAVVFSLHDCLTVIRNDQSLYGTVINPYSDNLVISRETLNFISEDSNIMKNEIVSFGIPNELPEKLMSKLTRYFTKSPVINAAFLLQLIRGKVNKSYLLVIDTSDESILKELTSFSKYLNKGEILDIVSLKSDFGKTAVEGFSPFFVKK